MKEKFIIQNEQYSFPYHWIQYGDYEGFNLFCKVFSKGRFWYKSATDEFVKMIVAREPMSILDVGRGDGLLLAHIADALQGSELWGVDLSKEAINFAYAFRPELNWLAGDFREINRKFECITCIETLEHIPDESIQDFVRGLYDKLEDNGELIVSVPTICKPVSPKHYRHYTINLLKEEFKEVESNLELVDFYYMNKETKLANLYYQVFCKANSCRIKVVEKIFYAYYLRKCLYGTSERECLRLVARFVKKKKVADTYMKKE